MSQPNLAGSSGNVQDTAAVRGPGHETSVFEDFKWATRKSMASDLSRFFVAFGVVAALTVPFQLYLGVGYETALIATAAIGWSLASLAHVYGTSWLSNEAFLLHSLKRLQQTTDYHDLEINLQFFFRDVEAYFRHSIGRRQHRAFMLRSIRDKDDLKAGEKPTSMEHVFQVITRDCIDRAVTAGSREKPLHRLEKRLRPALEGAKPEHKLRMALRDLYLEASPTYREFVVSPPSPGWVKWIEDHEVISGTLIFGGIVTVLAAVVGKMI